MSFAALCRLLEERIGLDPQSLGELALRQAFEEVRIRAGYANLERCYDAVKDGGEGLNRLIEAVSIPESWFFRDATQLESFVRFALQHKARRSSALNILCLPCARGEEPFSLAISLFEAGFEAREFNICAIDLNQTFIDYARIGRFASWSSRGRSVPSAYAEITPQGLQISQLVRDAVRFRVGNALDSNLLNGESKFDVIFCRNLLIYLTASAKKQLLQQLRLKLTDGGLIVSGHAENIAAFDNGWQQAPTLTSHCFIRRTAQPVEVIEIARAKSQSAPGALGSSERAFTRLNPYEPAKPVGPLQPNGDADSDKRSPVSAVESMSGGGAHAQLTEIEAQADRGELAAARKGLDAFLAQCGAAIPAQAAYLEAVLAMARSDTRAAIAALKQALYLDREHAEALSLYATLMQSQGDLESARRLRERLQRVWQAGVGARHGRQ